MMGRRIQHHHAAPLELLEAASDTLERYGEDYPEEDLTEALARIHHEVTESFGTVSTDGPWAVSNGYLVYSVSGESWGQLCDSLEIYEDARKWSLRAELLAALRLAAEDPCEPQEDIKEAVTGENRPLVVEAPWG